MFGFINLGVKEAIKNLNALDFKVAYVGSIDGGFVALKIADSSKRAWQSNFDRESMLRQKVKKKWLVEGDSNSTLFHHVLKLGLKRNSLLGLNSVDNWIDKAVNVKKEVNRHFKERF